MTTTNDAAKNSTAACTSGKSRFGDRLDGQPAEAGPGEDLLGEDRAAEQGSELEADHRDDGQRGVAQAVAEHDLLPVLRPFALAVRM